MTSTIARPASMTDIDIALPAQFLWGAAQCASTDEYKGSLHCVQVELKWHDSENVHATICATNGHIAYRVHTIAKGKCDSLTSSESEPIQILLLAKTLCKILKTEKAIQLTRIAGELRIQGFKMGIRPDAEYLGGATYPNIHKVWPDVNTLDCNPGGFVAFSGAYLEIIGKVAQRTTESGVLRVFTGEPSTPAILQTDAVEGTDCPAFLLMPVQVRG